MTLSDWEYFPHLGPRPIKGFVGLRNAGATCYMNSVLQQVCGGWGRAEDGWEGELQRICKLIGCWSWFFLSVLVHLHLTPHTSLLRNSLQLFMIPEVREGVVQFDQCAELFEDPEDDDEKPLLPAGPTNRKDEPIEVRRHNSTSCPSMGPPPHPTPPHPTSFSYISTQCVCCHAFHPIHL